MSSGTITLGLIGAGRIGSFHAETIARRLVNAELVAIADPVPGAAEGLAKRLGCANAYENASQPLAQSDLDAVIIATPARFHTNIVVEAMEAGKAVFCEKPMALTIADATRAVEAARAAGMPLQVGGTRGSRSSRRRSRPTTGLSFSIIIT